MNSIRTKLFLNISFLLVFFVLAAWCLSAMFLEDFYVWNKKRSLIESGRAIAALYAAGGQNISLEMERIADNIGAGIVIIGRDGFPKYTSFERLGHQPRREPRPPGNGRFDDNRPPHLPITITASEEFEGNTIIERQYDQVININFLVLRRELDDGNVLLIRLPLAAVTESAAYANKFTALSGLLAIMAGCIWAYFFARKFTAPLLQLGEVAAGIARLDFTQRCQVTGNDEVGRLGDSINNLSCQLNKSITELNEKNRQLMEDMEKERRLDKLRKDFISSVSHELRTPISLILGYAEGLKENVARDGGDREYYCAVIADEAAKMSKLVNGLLDLSQIESGYLRLDRTDFDLSSMLADIAQKYQAILREKNITLLLAGEPFVWANGDAFRIEQVILNLLNNAITHVDDERLVKVTTVDAGDSVRVEVFNSGRHIPPDSRENLWLSFYKADQARTRGLGGYGLGLSIVRAIQELHGNAYGVENVAGGVTFWFHIDRAGKNNSG
jgi:two-component system sensor histidine kinase VanS